MALFAPVAGKRRRYFPARIRCVGNAARPRRQRLRATKENRSAVAAVTKQNSRPRERAVLYAGALRASIIALKREPHVSRHLVLLMYETYQRAPLNRATRIVPVPLHPEREKQRGFNQAAILANALSKLARLPVAEHALARTEHTGRHRAGMDAQARRESVADAFVVIHPRTIAGEHILLVDDVFTTGATASACSRVLLEAGAEEVLVLTIARRHSSFGLIKATQ